MKEMNSKSTIFGPENAEGDSIKYTVWVIRREIEKKGFIILHV